MRLARIELGGRPYSAWVAPYGGVFALDGDLDFSGLSPEDLMALGKEITAAVAAGKLAEVTPDRWLPPVARPGKVIGVAMNNSAFAAASYRYFTKPAFFMKSPSALIGHREAVIVREDYGLTHPEAELACVIGRRARNLDEATARDVIFGYTIMNDITSVGLKDEDSLQLEFRNPIPGQTPAPWRRARDAEDWDLYLTYHFRSKCTDTFGPIGPWITTADEVPDPDALAIRAWLGERMIAEDTTANLTFSIAQVLAHLTRYTTLEPGDIVHFGTAVDPRRFALREANLLREPRDIRIEIERIGELINPVQLVPDDWRTCG